MESAYKNETDPITKSELEILLKKLISFKGK
jgi:hypothetical protein